MSTEVSQTNIEFIMISGKASRMRPLPPSPWRMHAYDMTAVFQLAGSQYRAAPSPVFPFTPKLSGVLAVFAGEMYAVAAQEQSDHTHFDALPVVSALLPAIGLSTLHTCCCYGTNTKQTLCLDDIGTKIALNDGKKCLDTIDMPVGR